MPIPIPRRPLLGWLALAAGLAGGWLVAIHRLNPPSSPPAGGTVEVQGVRLSASAQHDRQRAAELFGFDIRGAGLLPVHLSIHNQSHQAVRINPAQTFLIERGLAWPLLTADQARRRLAAVGAPFGLPGDSPSAWWRSRPDRHRPSSGWNGPPWASGFGMAIRRRWPAARSSAWTPGRRRGAICSFPAKARPSPPMLCAWRWRSPGSPGSHTCHSPSQSRRPHRIKRGLAPDNRCPCGNRCCSNGFGPPGRKPWPPPRPPWRRARRRTAPARPPSPRYPRAAGYRHGTP